MCLDGIGHSYRARGIHGAGWCGWEASPIPSQFPEALRGCWRISVAPLGGAIPQQAEKQNFWPLGWVMGGPTRGGGHQWQRITPNTIQEHTCTHHLQGDLRSSRAHWHQIEPDRSTEKLGATPSCFPLTSNLMRMPLPPLPCLYPELEKGGIGFVPLCPL